VSKHDPVEAAVVPVLAEVSRAGTASDRHRVLEASAILLEVIPANAGIQEKHAERDPEEWIPASAGMTTGKGSRDQRQPLALKAPLP
jgi:hypothetical protein